LACIAYNFLPLAKFVAVAGIVTKKAGVKLPFVLLFLWITLGGYAQKLDSLLFKPFDGMEETILSSDSASNIRQRILDLRKAGVTDEEIKEFFKYNKNAADVDSLLSKGNTKDKNELKDSLREEEKEEKKPKEKQYVKKDTLPSSQVFGRNFFIEKSLNFTPDENPVPPENYKLGPGDEIWLHIWGTAEFHDSYVLDNEGAFYPENGGKINVRGLTLKKANEVVSTKYRDIVSANARTEITVGKVRTIRVSITGEVVQPGTYVVSALTSAFNLLYLAGGPTEEGSFRNLVLRRNGMVADSLDLYPFLTDAGKSNDLWLENNDVLIIPVAKKRVLVKGEVKRPAIYELKESEQLSRLILLAGGLTSKAFKTNIQLVRTDLENEIVLDVDLNKLQASGADYVLKDGDRLTIGMVYSKVQNSVEVIGAAKYPGLYQVNSGEKVSDLLRKAGGLKEDAYKVRAYILRINESYKIDYLPVDLLEIMPEGEIITGGNTDYELKKFDALKIFSLEEFKDQEYVTIRGFVRKPGTFLLSGSRSLKDLIYTAGGIRPEAENSRIEISRVADVHPEKGNIGNLKVEVKQILLEDDWEKIVALDSFKLKPYDRIFVYKSPSFEVQEVVVINGQIKYPGEYTKMERLERISTLIKRAGELTPDAYPEGTKVYRNTEGEIAVNLQKALKNPGSKYDIILRNGDVVYIPDQPDVVRVRGEVLVEVNVQFDPAYKSARKYVNAAGGFNDKGWRRKTLVTYANGNIKKTQNFLFFKNFPTPEKGCTVLVPPKPQRRNPFNVQQALTLATSALVLFTLINQINLTK